MTFRLRLTLWYSVLVMSIIIIFSVVVVTVQSRILRSQVDSTLNDVLDQVQEGFFGVVTRNPEGEPVLWTPFYPSLRDVQTPGVFVQFWREDEPNYPVSLSGNFTLSNDPYDAEALKSKEEVMRDVNFDKTNLRVLTRPLKTEDGYVLGHLQAAMSLDTINDATDQLLKVMIFGSGIGLLASVALGDWLARRSLRPIASITHTAEQIVVAEDLDRRIEYHGPQDELGYLITTFNGMIGRLERLFNSQQRFVADVSHELRTPLTAIQSHLDLIERYGLKENDPSIKVLKTETQRMSRLVSDLLMLAQADLGHLPIIKGNVQLDTLLLEVFEQALVLSNKKVRIDIGEIDEVKVVGDRDRLKQLLLNLVTNSIKYTAEGGLVILALEHKGDVAEIRVKDNGIGIPPEDLPNIFDRFYRVDKARARQMGGAGLGLSIAKWIADAHNAELTVESEINKGTTFILRFDLTDDAEPEDYLKETRPRFPVITRFNRTPPSDS